METQRYPELLPYLLYPRAFIRSPLQLWRLRCNAFCRVYRISHVKAPELLCSGVACPPVYAEIPDTLVGRESTRPIP